MVVKLMMVAGRWYLQLNVGSEPGWEPGILRMHKVLILSGDDEGGGML
jgi:hypothetical protein